jgi:predicted amidophosphoribosyltransferase
VFNIPVEVAWIRRKNYTLSQTYFSADERKENVRDVFRIEQKAADMVKGATILLVDDILTTGSTLNACAMTLLEGGARLVNAATVAKA